MITIVCGEDNSSSRLFYADKIKEFKERGFNIENIAPEELKNLKDGHSDKTLFGSTTVYSIENLHKAYTRRKKELNDLLNQLSGSKDLSLITWEDSISKRDLGVTARVNIREFRPEKNIFKLLESCYPGNLKDFVYTLNKVRSKSNDFFVFIMLSRHIKKLLLYQLDVRDPNLAPWQESKIYNQQKFWNYQKLLDFYNSLILLDVLIKKGKTPFNVFNYIETLSVYYL